jgi:isoquinoline 1-oxidoreductase alpha subunit
MKLTINGREVAVPDGLRKERLVHTLREHFGLVGTKLSCGIGECGACTVHVKGEPVRSCIVSTESVVDAEVLTIEGLADREGALHPLQRAWIDERVSQCGFCQAGQIMQAASLLARNAAPENADIVEAMSGNLCRCGTYDRIRRGIRRAAAVSAESNE